MQEWQTRNGCFPAPCHPLAGPAAGACLIAVASALAMVGQGNFTAPPRYDGAGYAVLARSLAAGTGYRAIDHPDRPRHAHFPPGYPVMLALVWSLTGPSALAAHLVSSLCTIGATLGAWWWFRGLYPRAVALVLGLALALNWGWVRTGSAIQSEPLYMLLSQVTILAAVRAAARGSVGRCLALGGLLAACLLTSQIAIGLVVAVLAGSVSAQAMVNGPEHCGCCRCRDLTLVGLAGRGGT